MRARESRLLRIAERVADAQPVDWDAEMRNDPETSAGIRNLRELERIRVLHQRAPVTADDTPTRDLRAVERSPRSERGLATHGEWGKLRLVELVGRGSYGEVWRAWDDSLQTHVALKLLHRREPDPQEVLREARQMAKVRHENVVAVYGAAEHGGRVGIWSEFIRGKTLESELTERGPLGAAEAAVVAEPLLKALAAVHAAGLVHRDIKTTNVMREEGGRIVLMDFGTVVESEAPESGELGEAFVGTARYMAPEIFRGDRGSQRSDLYSLGVVLYRLVSGKYPMTAHTVVELREMHAAGGPVPLRDARPDLPAAFVHLVERALAPRPEERYASAGAMERDLSAFLAGTGATTGAGHHDVAGERRSGPAGWLNSIRRRSWIPVTASVLVLLAWLQWGRPGSAELSVQASLFRAHEGEEVRLASGAQVRPGDQLFLEIETSQPVHAYVFNEDERGNAYLLFPLDGMEPANPLRPGAAYRLPGRRDGTPMTWDVDTYGGGETLYVIASRTPLGDLEAEMARLPQAGSAPGLALPFESLRRGIGGLAPAPGPGARDDGPPLAGVFAHLAGAASGARGLWTWSIRLENPAP